MKGIKVVDEKWNYCVKYRIIAKVSSKSRLHSKAKMVGDIKKILILGNFNDTFISFGLIMVRAIVKTPSGKNATAVDQN